MIRAFAGLLVWVACVAVARAESDADFAQLHTKLLRDVIVARNLDARSADNARSVAAVYVYIGPCQGTVNNLPKNLQGFWRRPMGDASCA